jgi:hypothetical protein
MTTNLLRKLLVASMMAVPMATSVSPMAQARSTPVFTLVNRTRSPLVRFYASPSGSRNWEENILGGKTLRPSGQVRVTINDGRKTCIYDIRGDFADGDKVEDYKVNICTVGTYRFIER